MIHRLYEEVDWLESFKWDSDYLYSLIRHFAVAEEKLQRWLFEFRESLELSSVQELLSQNAQPGAIDGTPVKWSSWRERRFCLSLPDDRGRETLWNGVIDRVNIARSAEEEILAGTIIDYKTDDFTQSKVELYRPQIEIYHRVVTDITQLDYDQVHAGLLFLASDSFIAVHR